MPGKPAARTRGVTGEKLRVEVLAVVAVEVDGHEREQPVRALLIPERALPEDEPSAQLRGLLLKRTGIAGEARGELELLVHEFLVALDPA